MSTRFAFTAYGFLLLLIIIGALTLFLVGKPDYSNETAFFIKAVREKSFKSIEPIPAFRPVNMPIIRFVRDPFADLKDKMEGTEATPNLFDRLFEDSRMIGIDSDTAMVKLGDVVYIVKIGDKLFDGNMEVKHIGPDAVVVEFRDQTRRKTLQRRITLIR